MQLEWLAENWRMGMGDLIMLAHNNKEDKMQAVLHLDRYLRKIYSSHEIPMILRRHSPVLGSSIIDFLIHNNNSAPILMDRLRKEGA